MLLENPIIEDDSSREEKRNRKVEKHSTLNDKAPSYLTPEKKASLPTKVLFLYPYLNQLFS